MASRKVKKLAALASVPLIAVASYLSFRNMGETARENLVAVAETRPQSRPANELYMKRYEIEHKERFEKWLNGLRQYKNAETRPSLDIPLDQMIQHMGYEHLRSNVSSLDEAQLICLGEIHQLCGNEEAHILGDEFVGEYDKILVEDSTNLRVDFPAMKKEREIARAKWKEKKKESNKKMTEWLKDISKPESQRTRAYDHFGDMGDSVEGLYSVIDSLRHTWRHLDFLRLEDGKESSFFSGLARHNSGIVIGADAPRNIKIAHMYALAELAGLPHYLTAVESGETPHPFLEWMVHDGAGASNRSASDSEKIKAINNYMGKILPHEEHMRRRDERIAENTLREVNSNPAGRRSWYIFGASHLNSTLFTQLENNGIRYVAFTPIEEEVAADSKPEELILSGKLGEQHEDEYLETAVLPWYVKEKVIDGKPTYTGSFEGIIKRK